MQIAEKVRTIVFPGKDVSSLDLKKHIPALDGVRGLAVLLVLCYDCLKLHNDGFIPTLIARKFAASGWIGVDLFFVLSGFLITGILLDTAGRKGYWKSFILRRSVRIFPLYYGTLIVVFAIAPLVCLALGYESATGALAAVKETQFWYWGYLQNWLFAWQGAWPDGRVLNHFWSLAVEEQFYLIWPFVVIACSRKRLAWVCFGLCLTALTLRYTLLINGVPGVTTYVMTITRMDSLCAGALLAIAFRSPGWASRRAKYLPILCAAGFVMLLGVDVFYPILKSQSFAAYSIGHSLVAIVFATLIGTLVLLTDRHFLSRLFCFAGLTTLGKYSYAIYVFHRFVYRAVKSYDWNFLPQSAQSWAIFSTTLVLSYLVARISWLLWESPFLALKVYMPRPDADFNKPAVDNNIESKQQETRQSVAVF